MQQLRDEPPFPPGQKHLLSEKDGKEEIPVHGRFKHLSMDTDLFSGICRP
jgi:hypothetical protein